MPFLLNQKNYAKSVEILHANKNVKVILVMVQY